MARGFANCDNCGKACQVSGGWEPLFKLVLAGLVLAVIGLSALAFTQLGTIPGAVVLGVGVVAILVTLAAS